MSSYDLVINGLCEKVQRKMASQTGDEIEWDVGSEILLFYAMIGHKPVGLNRHFMMLAIHNKLSTYFNREISAKPIWQHLDTMYDMAALHESEIIPFPNDEVEFTLPADEYDGIAMERLGVKISSSSTSGSSSTKASSSTKLAKKIVSSKFKPSTSTSPMPSTSKASDDAHFRKPLPQTTPVSVKLNKNPLADTKSTDKGTPSSSYKLDKIKMTKQPELMHAEVKVEAATPSQLKKALKLDKPVSEEKDRKVPTSGGKVSKLSLDSSNNKPNLPRDDIKGQVRSDLVKKESLEGKSISKSVKKESSHPQSTTVLEIPWLSDRSEGADRKLLDVISEEPMKSRNIPRTEAAFL